ncbi:MAG: glycosyltransferase [Kiritimatiellales bacterium]|nr:glycosyltransferase [Kiritimatiellales bacterium]
MKQKKKIAFIHRYGLEGWICCGGHAVPGIIDTLSKDAEIHFYGPKTTEERNSSLRANLVVHELPYTWNRANPNDKITKTIPWYFWLPIIALRCRLNGTRLIWNDETVPFTAPILRVFFGRNIVITVMDFFARIYTDKHPRLHALRDLVERIDFASWKKLPLIFTKVLYTQEFLAEHGVPKEVMHLYRNPVDHTKFHPVDEVTRQETRNKLGFADTDIVLSHHGILHPNKGNDWILHRLAELKEDLPNLRYLLIGDGPEMGNLQQLASRLGIIDRVVFTGWLPSERDLNNALASSDIGLVMRIGQETDHFHMTDTLAHEMACGKPILAVNLKGIAEVIHDDENGALFSGSAPLEFCSKIKPLYQSGELRISLGKAALDLSKDICSIALCSDQISGLLATKINPGNQP